MEKQNLGEFAKKEGGKIAKSLGTECALKY
jgi:hypothetical protein